MFSNIKTHLGFKIILPFMAGFLLIAFGLIGFWLPSQIEFRNAEVDRHTHSYTQLLATSLTPSLLTGDLEAIHATLDEAVSIKRADASDWRQLILTNSNGQIVYPLSLIGQLGPDTSDWLRLDVESNGQHLGDILVDVDRSQVISEAYQAARGVIGITILLVFSFSALIVTLLYRMIVLPIKELEGAALHLADDDYDVELPPAKQDEIGSLINAFSHLKKTLQEQKGAIETYFKEQQDHILEAEHARDMANRVNATLSHEIRSPMNAVIGLTEVVLESEINAEQRDNLTMIHQSAKSLMHVLNDVLNFAKLEDGKMVLEERPFSVEDAITDIANRMQHAAEKKGLTLDYDVTAAKGQIYIGDSLRIQLILSNLLGNALKFTDEGGVSVSASVKENGELLFRVSDTGIGITETDTKRIFDSYFQADSMTSRLYGGTGLGTTIAKYLVGLMGGEIWVESALGKGSVFYFTAALPKASEQLEADPDSHTGEITATRLFKRVEPVANENTDQISVLIAEDMFQNAALLSLRLKAAGYQSKIASNGQEAVKFETESPFDIILMDVNMPLVDGLQATKMIRALEEGTQKHTPIIGVSAGVTAQQQEDCRLAGMDAFIGKPIDFEALYKTILELLPKND